MSQVKILIFNVLIAQWTKISLKKVQFWEATLFASKSKITTFFFIFLERGVKKKFQKTLILALHSTCTVVHIFLFHYFFPIFSPLCGKLLAHEIQGINKKTISVNFGIGKFQVRFSAIVIICFSVKSLLF